MGFNEFQILNSDYKEITSSLCSLDLYGRDQFYFLPTFYMMTNFFFAFIWLIICMFDFKFSYKNIYIYIFACKLYFWKCDFFMVCWKKKHIFTGEEVKMKFYLLIGICYAVKSLYIYKYMMAHARIILKWITTFYNHRRFVQILYSCYNNVEKKDGLFDVSKSQIHSSIIISYQNFSGSWLMPISTYEGQ